MTDTDLSLVQCTDERAWDAFVDHSPQGTVFCRPAFLRALPVRAELWQVLGASGAVKLGIVLLRDTTGRLVQQPYSFSLYQGLLFDAAVWQAPLHRAVAAALRSVGYMLTKLCEREECVSLCLHYTVHDVRSFLWFACNEPAERQWQVRVRYTGLIEAGTDSFDHYWSGVRKSRRAEYRHCQQAGFVVEASGAVETFLELYRQTFARQGIALAEEVMQLVRSITEAALTQGFGELLMCRTAERQPVAATVFLHDRQSSYYLFGATDPAYRREGVGTYTVASAIRRSLEQSRTRIDVAGINSPARGDYKVSFNARPTPFYVVSWQRA